MSKEDIQSFLDELVEDYRQGDFSYTYMGEPMESLSTEEVLAVLHELAERLEIFEHLARHWRRGSDDERRD